MQVQENAIKLAGSSGLTAGSGSGSWLFLKSTEHEREREKDFTETFYNKVAREGKRSLAQLMSANSIKQ